MNSVSEREHNWTGAIGVPFKHFDGNGVLKRETDQRTLEEKMWRIRRKIQSVPRSEDTNSAL
jgi:hypothetical protein